MTMVGCWHDRWSTKTDLRTQFVFTAIKRYLIILIAYLLAVAATAVGVGVLMVLTGSTSFLRFLPLCALVFMIISIFASAPVAVVVGIGEWRVLSKLWYYAGAGVLAGLVLGGVFRLQWWFPIAGVLLGALVGTIYWAVAGRNAGVLKTLETAKAQTHLLLLLGSSVVIVVALILVFLR
jgi:hypothetical protein